MTVLDDGLYLGFLRQSQISVQAQRRLKESVPMGGTTPDLLSVDQTPHLSLFHQSQFVRDHVFFVI